MVVEDNDLNRKLFCDVLKANGFEVEPVAEGDKVLETARATAPDLIIMDIQLGGVSGVDLIEAAKRDRRLSAIPVLAVTAFAAKGDEERIRAAGAEGYLSAGVHRPVHERRERARLTAQSGTEFICRSAVQ